MVNIKLRLLGKTIFVSPKRTKRGIEWQQKGATINVSLSEPIEDLRTAIIYVNKKISGYTAISPKGSGKWAVLDPTGEVVAEWADSEEVFGMGIVAATALFVEHLKLEQKDDENEVA
jgi:hypothetical protein